MIQINETDQRAIPGADFSPGQVVKHRRYGYRGVVVDVDEECRAGDTWYKANQTQPGRIQPWYHVLVDGAVHTTYVAQENLEADELGAPVAHPLLEQFFTGFENGCHIRNDIPLG